MDFFNIVFLISSFLIKYSCAISHVNLTRDSIALSQMINIFYEEYSIEMKIIVLEKSNRSIYFESLAKQVMRKTIYPLEILVTNDFRTIFDYPLKSHLIMSHQNIFPAEFDVHEFVNFFYDHPNKIKAYARLALIHYGNNNFTIFDEKNQGEKDFYYETLVYNMITSIYHLSEIYYNGLTGSLEFDQIFPSKNYGCASKWDNTFNVSKNSWISRHFLHNHEKNFQKCKFEVFLLEEYEYLFKRWMLTAKEFWDPEKPEDSIKKLKLDGYLGFIMNTYAERNNLELNVGFGMECLTHMYIPAFVPDHENNRYRGYRTFPLATYKFTFIATRGQPYSPFEKLVLPFDYPTWILVSIIFLLGFLIILIFHQSPQPIQDFIFGRNISSPTLGLIQIFFGIGLVQTPGRNFARYQFMMFTLYCLIIRTAYQGVMFEIMTTDVRKPTVNTYEDVIDQNIPVKLSRSDDAKGFKL